MTELQWEMVFQQNIVVDEFSLCPPQAAPVVVIAIDSPGAPTDQRISQISERLTRQGARPAVLSHQVLESHDHRNIAAALRGHPPPPEVAATVRWWSRRSDDWIQTYRVNAILKIPATRADEAIARIQAYRDAGYLVTVSLPVVSPPVRWWGQLERYVAGRAAGLPHRRPNLTARDTYTEGLRRIARHLDRHRIAHVVEVLRPVHRTVNSLTNARAVLVDMLRDAADWTTGRGGIEKAVDQELRQPVGRAIARQIVGRLRTLRADATHPEIHDQIDHVARAIPRIAPTPPAVGTVPMADVVAAATRARHAARPQQDPQRGA